MLTIASFWSAIVNWLGALVVGLILLICLLGAVYTFVYAFMNDVMEDFSYVQRTVERKVANAKVATISILLLISLVALLYVFLFRRNAMIPTELVLTFVFLVGAAGAKLYPVIEKQRRAAASRRLATPVQTAQAPTRSRRLANTLGRLFDRSRYGELGNTLSDTFAGKRDVPVVKSAIRATEALIELRQGIDHAKSTRVEKALTDDYSRQVEVSAAALWRNIERLDAVLKQDFTSQVIDERLSRESTKLSNLAVAMKEAHEGILLLTMSDFGKEDVRAAEHALLGLREMAGILDT